MKGKILYSIFLAMLVLFILKFWLYDFLFMREGLFTFGIDAPSPPTYVPKRKDFLILHYDEGGGSFRGGYYGGK